MNSRLRRGASTAMRTSVFEQHEPSSKAAIETPVPPGLFIERNRAAIIAHIPASRCTKRSPRSICAAGLAFGNSQLEFRALRLQDRVFASRARPSFIDRPRRASGFRRFRSTGGVRDVGNDAALHDSLRLTTGS